VVCVEEGKGFDKRQQFQVGILWKSNAMAAVPSARSISASFCLSQRLCMVLRNSSTVIKPLPSASNS
jgi:hypothetical protein